MNRTEHTAEDSDQESGRVSLRAMRVSGTELAQALDRVVNESTQPTITAAAFSSSI